ncbi:MAG TPA: cell envelope integrity protein CreD [Thermoanaerobaculia bacterium]|nr:cell envelope integrity protein CreD [Thermoanaerobaculia bacterium]
MFEREGRNWRDSAMVKLLSMGGLIVVLLIPVWMVGSLIAERQNRRLQALNEVAGTWGGTQTLGGLVLTVPFRQWHKDDHGKPVSTRVEAQFLPESLNVEARVLPERRRRGIYEAVLYRTQMKVSGTFRPSFAASWHVAPTDILWEDARLSIGLSELRGLRRVGDLLWQGRALQLAPGGAEPGLWDVGLRTPVPGLAAGAEGREAAFALDLAIDGSGTLSFLPFGKQTTVTMSSPWPDPSFCGALLPESSRVGRDGFTARWSVPYFARGYPQQWIVENPPKAWQSGLQGSAFGVSLLLPEDSYEKTETSQKYAILFLLLTFVTFFLYDLRSPVAIHPVQQLLVGAALCSFYLLLLSISEHLPFGPSYAIAGAATILLITGYAMAILAGRARALLLGAILTVLYGFLYVLLQAEDYALLLGSIALFAILALVMYLTRRVDWRNVRERSTPSPAAPPGA